MFFENITTRLPLFSRVTVIKIPDYGAIEMKFSSHSAMHGVLETWTELRILIRKNTWLYYKHSNIYINL